MLTRVARPKYLTIYPNRRTPRVFSLAVLSTAVLTPTLRKCRWTMPSVRFCHKAVSNRAVTCTHFSSTASFGKLPTPAPPVGPVQPSPTTGEELRQLEALAISIAPPLDDVAHAVGQGMTSAALRNPTDEIILKLCDVASARSGGPAIPALRLTLQHTSSAFCASIALEGGPSAIRKRIAYFRALEEEFEAVDRLCSVLSAL